MVLSLLIALLLNQKIPGVAVWRTIYYLPSVVSGVAVAMLWVWLFHSQFGLINLGLAAIGIQGPAWLRDPDWALMALVIMSFWGIGGGMVINLAGLQGIPTELYEAAKIDGAGIGRRFFHITLPMISPTLFFVLVTDMIWTFQVFTNVFVMTDGKGGPANSTLMYVLYLYNVAFRQYRMGFASALAWVFFVVIMALTVLIFRSSSAWVYYETEIGGRRA